MLLKDALRDERAGKRPLARLLTKYSEDQPRDEQGRWTYAAGGEGERPAHLAGLQRWSDKDIADALSGRSGLFHAAERSHIEAERVRREKHVESAANRIYRATDFNAHTEALRHMATYLGLRSEVRELRDLEAEHGRRGGLTAQMSQRREAVAQRLDEYARRTMAPASYQRLKDAF